MSKSIGCDEAKFLKDVAAHEMIILRDDWVYRHIRFKAPGTGCMHFDLVTWPGYLAYSGDMGCYVFSRLTDMFEFFRTDRKYQKGGGLKINLSYWGEKLQAIDGNRHSASGVEEFDEEKFTRIVMEYLVEWIRGNRYSTTKDERRELWGAVIYEVVQADSDSDGHRKRIAAHDFQHDVNKYVRRFEFRDFWENDCTSYTFHFTWCCYALAWAIKQYDDSKTAVPA